MIHNRRKGIPARQRSGCFWRDWRLPESVYWYKRRFNSSFRLFRRFCQHSINVLGRLSQEVSNMSHKRIATLAVVAIVGIAMNIPGQGRPSFDVVSIKANNSGTGFLRIGGQPAAGRFVATNATVEMLIAWAYRVQNYQLSGGPAWITADTFDIEARSDRGALTPDEMASMVQSLLADRFRLKIHRETTEGSVYALVVGKNGLKMKRSADETPVGGQRGPGGGRPRGETGPGARGPIPLDGPPGERGGGPPRGGGRMAPGFAEVNGVSMPMLVEMLAQQLGRPVIDRTDLKGLFDIRLEWATDPNFAGPRGPGGGLGPDIGASTSGPSLFTAVEEQLGLRLEPAKGPVEKLVIDSVQRPSQN
jgi:uncharacterized protein (TIGR03435 family)